MKYDKPPLSIDQQIDLLISRGMVIPDRDRAVRYLTHINYYRLRAYWLIYEQQNDNGEHSFKSGTEFEQALALYIFDRKFRLLVLEAIERVEVSLRTRFAYVLANKYGSHAYLNRELFRSADIYAKCLESFREEYDRSRETFIEHYKETYTEPELPPIWAACEIMSFGQLSKWFANVKLRKDRNDIASVFNINEDILNSFMHHLTHVRNLVAHHSRLWNRRLTFTMMIPRRPKEIAEWFNQKENRKIYNTLVMLGYMVSLMSPGSTWAERVKHLIDENSIVKPEYMGFPYNWKEVPMWRGKA